MAKFYYRMQNILDIKEKLENQAKVQYSQAKKKFDDETDKLKDLMNIKSRYEKELVNVMESKLDIRKMRELNLAIDSTSDKIEIQKIEVIKAYKRMNVAKEKLSEVMMERKMHEKLRENAFDEFIKQINLDELKEIDELVSFKFNSEEQ